MLVKEPSVLIVKRMGSPRCSWFDRQHNCVKGIRLILQKCISIIPCKEKMLQPQRTLTLSSCISFQRSRRPVLASCATELHTSAYLPVLAFRRLPGLPAKRNQNLLCPLDDFSCVKPCLWPQTPSITIFVLKIHTKTTVP